MLYDLKGAPKNVTIDGFTHYFTGDTLELNCSANGSPELQYSWSRNTSSGHNMFPTDTTSDSNYITISNVTVDDKGVYTCTVSNEGGNSSYNIFITITGKNWLQSFQYILYAYDVCIILIFYVCICTWHVKSNNLL